MPTRPGRRGIADDALGIDADDPLQVGELIDGIGLIALLQQARMDAGHIQLATMEIGDGQRDHDVERAEATLHEAGSRNADGGQIRSCLIQQVGPIVQRKLAAIAPPTTQISRQVDKPTVRGRKAPHPADPIQGGQAGQPPSDDRGHAHRR